MPKQLAYFFGAFAMGLALVGLRHPYYLSICEIDHNPHAKTLEITFKIFTDDLEEALTAQGAGMLKLGTAQEARQADRHIFSYLQNNVAVIVNGDTTGLSYVGKEVELDVTWCYVEAKQIANVEKIEISSRLLIERHEEQANIVHVTVGKTRKSLLLHKQRTGGALEFP